MPAFRPLHQATGLGREIIPYPQIFQLLGCHQTVEIEVVASTGLQLVGFDQRIGGAFYQSFMTEAGQKSPDEGGFAGTQRARKIYQARKSTRGSYFAAATQHL